MFRRTNGRTPSLLLGGLILFILILSFSYWNLNTQNNDVLQSVEKLQANLKIGDVKIEQSERKMSALQDLLHEKEEAIKQSENKLLQQEDNIKTYNSDLRKRDYQITTLKDDINKLQDKVQILEDKIVECEGDNEKILKENDLLMSQRDDAITALSKRDEQISDLSRKLDQGTGVQHENSVLGQQQVVVHAISSKSPAAAGVGVAAAGVGESPASLGVVAAGGGESLASAGVAADVPGANVAAPPQSHEQGAGVLHQPLKAFSERDIRHDAGPGDTGHQPPQEVLPQPPGFQDNLDAAVDEVARPGEEDPLLPDQDPGGEVARQEQRLQDPRLHQHSVHDGGEGRLDRFGGGDEDEDEEGLGGGAAGTNNQDFVDDGGNLVGGRGLEGPLINREDNEGGEVETGDQQPAPADQELLENGAKENFFGEDPPLRLRINGNNDNMLVNDKQNSLDDNMVLQ